MANLNIKACLVGAEHVAEYDNADAEGVISADELPELGKVQVATAKPAYYLDYNPEAGKPPFWKFWKRVEPHFKPGDVTSLQQENVWSGATITTNPDGSILYSYNSLEGAGEAQHLKVSRTTTKAGGELLSYREWRMERGALRTDPEKNQWELHDEYYFAEKR